MKSKLTIVNKYLEPMILSVNSSIKSVKYEVKRLSQVIIDERIKITYDTGNILEVNVTKDSIERLVIDVMNAII